MKNEDAPASQGARGPLGSVGAGVSCGTQGNNVGDEGCRLLFEAFRDCESLSQITVRSNRVGDLGAARWAHVDIQTLLPFKILY